MKDYVFKFRVAVREAGVIYDNDYFVNGFMWYESLYGEDIYNELIKELEKLKDGDNRK